MPKVVNMINRKPVVYINDEKCRNSYSCVRVCPVMPSRLSPRRLILIFFPTDASDVDYAMSLVHHMLLNSAIQGKM